MPTFVAAATGAATASALTQTATIPSAASAGHLLIAHVSQERGAAGMTLSGSGWTYGANNLSNGTQQTEMVAWRPLAAGEPGSTITATVTAGRRIAMSLLVYRDVASVQFVNGASAATGAGSNQSTGPAATPTADGAMLVALMASVNNVSPYTMRFNESAGWTERTDVTATLSTGANPQSASAEKLLTGGGGTSQSGPTWSAVSVADGSAVNNQFQWPSMLVLNPGTSNTPPTASFTSTATGQTASFNANASTDPDGSITAYAWDFGDSTSGTGATPTHSYATGGTYTVTLTVTDSGGATGTVSHDVTVTAPTTKASGIYLLTDSGWVDADLTVADGTNWP